MFAPLACGKSKRHPSGFAGWNVVDAFALCGGVRQSEVNPMTARTGHVHDLDG